MGASAPAALVGHSRLEESEDDALQLSAVGIDELLAASRHRLIAIPTLDATLTASEAAVEIADLLSGDATRCENRAFRLVIALHDALSSAPDHVLGTLVLTPPPPTGDERFDALVAGIVDLHLSRRRLPVPPWVAEEGRTLPALWHVSEAAGEGDLVPELLRHGVALAEAELLSV